VLAGLGEADDRQAFRALLQRVALHVATALESTSADPKPYHLPPGLSPSPSHTVPALSLRLAIRARLFIRIAYLIS
jgi:hypothetical protein